MTLPPEWVRTSLTSVASRIDAATRRQLNDLIGDLAPSPSSADFLDAAATAVSGGKRLRGFLALVGAELAQDEAVSSENSANAAHPSREAFDVLAAALELYQASALIHDDIIDHASSRRGHPTSHILLANAHRSRKWTGSSGEFGTAGAILLGDFLLSAADHALARSCDGLDTSVVPSVLDRFTLMHGEVALGQYLDVRAEHVPLDADDPTAISVEDSLEIVRRKSARYSVVHPIALGMIAAGASQEHVELVARITQPWGIAFQLRDDDLGVFGDPATTGKPAGDDLREGKRTVLLGLTWARSTHDERAELAAGLGNPNLDEKSLVRLAGLVEQRGRQAHERMIDGLVSDGNTALDDSGLGTTTRERLTAVAELLTRRTA